MSVLAGLFPSVATIKAQREKAQQRARHTSRSSVRRAEADSQDGGQPRELDVNELRRRRLDHYDVTTARSRSRRTEVAARARAKTSSSLNARSVTSNDRRSTSRRQRTSTASTSRRRDSEQVVSEGERRTEEYVYGARPAPLDPIDEEQQAGDGWPPPEAQDFRRRRSSRASSAGTLLNEVVHPDDSISQIGSRNRTEQRGNAFVRVRPSLRRSSTTSTRLDRVPEEPSRRASASSSRRRAGETAVSTSSRRHSTTSVPAPRPPVECLTCATEDVPAENAAELTCGHNMCHDCLRRVFELSVKDPVHMPPKCCQEEHIPLHHVAKLFDDKFKATWNRKYQEYHTKDRMYCPSPKCAHWIKPKHIHNERGRKSATCPKCQTKVCGHCNGKAHKSAECPKDPAIAKLVEKAKEEGWQRCWSCKAMVERTSGCNHMTCRCTAEFCIKCGTRWKMCDCPWYDPGGEEEQMRDFMRRHPGQRVHRIRIDDQALHVGGRDRNQEDPDPELTYQRQMDQRREQERLDADLARRLQLASIFVNDDEPRGARGNEDWDWGTGNAARHFLNDDFVQVAANVVMNAFGEAEFGRRGERASGRRRRARADRHHGGDPGLPRNFLGDESVLGVGPAR